MTSVQGWTILIYKSYPKRPNMKLAQEDFRKIPQLDQRQDSLTDQLNDLIAVADRLGMYDAADFIFKTLERNR